MTTALDRDPVAEAYDSSLRWKIASRSDPHSVHVVELDSYRENGECDCAYFEFSLRPILARGHTAETALAAGLVKLKSGDRREDVLRCFHIREAYHQFARQCVRAMSHAEKEHAKKTRR